MAAAPAALFQGCDSVLGQWMNTAAVDGTMESVGGTSFVKCDVCTTTTELMASLHVEQRLSVSYAGVVGISHKMQLLKSLKLTTSSTCIVVYARHTQGHEQAAQVRLRDGVSTPADGDQLYEFVCAYGDSYLCSRVVGGEYYAVYTYYCTSQEDQQELTADMEAAGLLRGVGVDASLQVKLNDFHSRKKCRTSFQQRMSGIANPEFPPGDKVVDFALAFPSMKLTAPILVEWGTAGYERVPGIGRKFIPVVRNRHLLAGPETSLALSRLSDLREDIRALQRLYALHGGYGGDTKLNSVSIEVEKDEKTVRELLAAYREDPTQALAGPLSLPSLAHGSPSFECVTHVFSVGDEGFAGKESDDVDLKTYFGKNRRISTIQLRTTPLLHDRFHQALIWQGLEQALAMSPPRILDAIVVTYTDDDGTHTITYGSQTKPLGSALTHQLVVRNGHFVNAVSGYCGHVDKVGRNSITSVTIGLDSGESLSAGPPSVGEPFSWTSSATDDDDDEGARTFLLAFRALDNWYIGALQLVYASFRPAKWSLII